MTKAIGALVAVVTVSILSMAAIAMLLGGFYKGRRRVSLDEQTDEDGHALRPVSTFLRISLSYKRYELDDVLIALIQNNVLEADKAPNLNFQINPEIQYNTII